MSVERNQELKDAFIYRDTRLMSRKFMDWITDPLIFRNLLMVYIVTSLIIPLIILPFTIIVFGTIFWWRIQKRRMPLRYPQWIKAKDPSTLDDKAPKMREGAGIEFVGNEKPGITIQGKDELWESDSDLRVHRLVMATTGGGKTNTLLSWMLNPLLWGSGFMYADGKAQNTLYVDIYAMCDLMWRTDDLLLVNYMMGGVDVFAELASGKKSKKKRKSNTLNPFGKANHDTINQLLTTMMPKSGGDGAQWQQKAGNMMAGVTQVSCYLRAKKESKVSVKTLRDNMSLQNIIKLSQRNDLPEAATGALKAYLNVGLPGFNADAVKAGKNQPQTALDQHGYLTGQFTAPLGLLADTYGHIFMDVSPEVDMLDVVLNNRILVVMIPTLEMSSAQAGNLGKIVVAATKMMMAANLGSDVEGSVLDLTQNRPTNTEVPYEVVLDELGYYFAEGIALMFAQARSLGIALTASGQDFQAMAKDNKNEVESMIANTGLKVALKTEDPKETFEVFQKAAGEVYVSRVSGFENNSGSSHYTGKTDASIEKQSKLSLGELRALPPGDGIVLFKDKVIRASMFDMYQDLKKLTPKDSNVFVNVLLPIDLPQLSDISAYCKPSSEDKTGRIMELVMSGNTPTYPPSIAAQEILFAISSAAAKIPEDTPATERGIVLFMSAFNTIKKQMEEVVPVESPTDYKDVSNSRDKARGASNRFDYLDNPPFVKVNESNSKNAVDSIGEDEIMGVDIETNQRHLELTEDTKQNIAELVSSLTAGANQSATISKETEKEIESIRLSVEAGCKFEDSVAEKKEEPSSFDSIEDLLNCFDVIKKNMDKKED